MAFRLPYISHLCTTMIYIYIYHAIIFQNIHVHESKSFKVPLPFGKFHVMETLVCHSLVRQNNEKAILSKETTGLLVWSQ